MDAIDSRQIQLNLNFFWESENININPSGWVLLESELNGIDCAKNSAVNLQFINTDSKNFEKSREEFNWDFTKTFFKTNLFRTGEYPQGIHLFTLKYEPEKFKGNYSTFLDKNSLDVYNKIEIDSVKTFNNEYFDFETNDIKKDPAKISIENLLTKQFTYKPYFTTDKKYSDTEFQFKYGIYEKKDLDLKLDKSEITDQLMVQLFKTSILKNIELEIPKKEQEIDGETFICKTGLIWKYKIAPIMPYGILESLAVTGAIDLMNIGIFNQSLNKFKYYNVDFQSQLLLDMTSYNSEGHTVDTVKLTFYDLFGKVCDYVIPKMVSYNGQFKVIVPLDGSLHDGMYAYDGNYLDKKDIYPNFFSTDPNLTSDTLKRAPKHDRVSLKTENYVDQLRTVIEDMDTEIKYYAYHDTSLPEGLHPNYLYWVTVSYNLEEDSEYVTLPDGYWYWTNTKFNEYYYDNQYDNYNDIDFDLDLTVKASISGNPTDSNTREYPFTEKDVLISDYTEKNKKEFPFKISIYPDFKNYYQTLRVNTSDVSTFIKSISYGVDSDRAVWDRELATININDEDLDKDTQHNYVNWSIESPFNTVPNDIQYYPTFGNTEEPVTFSGRKIRSINLTGVNYFDLTLNLFEDIERIFYHKELRENKQVSYHPVTTIPIEHRWVKSGMHGMDGHNRPKTVVFSTTSEQEIQQLDQHAKQKGYFLDTMDHIVAVSKGGDSAVSCFLPKGTSQHYYAAWFISTGNTPIPIEDLFPSDTSIGLISVYGYVGTFNTCYLENSDKLGWSFNSSSSKSWGDWYDINPYIGRDDCYKGKTDGIKQDGDTYIYYKYGSDYYLFNFFGCPFSDSLNTFYGIDESVHLLGQADNVLTSYIQNVGYLLNKQDLIINVEGKDEPAIYIGPFNVRLWDNIPGCNKDAKCIHFKFNGIAQTIQNLSIKLKYPEKYIDDLNYYKDPDTGNLEAYSNYTVFYKRKIDGIDNPTVTPVYTSSYDANRGLRISSFLNESNSYWGQGNCYMYYCAQEARKGDKDEPVIKLQDVSKNAMAGMLAIPYKILKTYE